jgi:NADPH:quinone reductase-like Zn-dependent oxidoreductase
MNGHAVRFHEFGGPEVLVHEEVEIPEPGEGEVQLRVLAAAVNRFDVDVREGTSRFPVALPHVGGIEVVGQIASIGPGVTGWMPGDRVIPDLMSPCGACSYCRAGRQSICAQPGFVSFSTGGGYADHLVCDASHLIPVPDGLGDIQAAALQMAFATAWHMLFTQGGLRAGERVLIHSVGSGVGSAALQLAKLAGASVVIGTASSPAKLEQAARLGLDAGIDHTSEDIVERVRAATGGTGVDLVFDHVGGPHFPAGLEALDRGGRVVICGGHAGEVVELDVIPFFRAERRIIGAQSHTRAETERILDLAARGRITPVVHKTFPLRETRAATELVERRENFGKVVIVP